MYFFIFLFLITFAKCDDIFDAKVEIDQDTYSDGKKRHFYVKTPDDFDSHQNYPALIAIHGYGGDAEGFALVTNLQNEAAHKYVIAFAEASNDNKSYNAGSCCGDSIFFNYDDISYFKALIDKLI